MEIRESATFQTAKELRDFLDNWTDEELDVMYISGGDGEVAVYPVKLSDGSYIQDFIVRNA